MTNQISQKIDSFAKKHLKELKQLENRMAENLPNMI